MVSKCRGFLNTFQCSFLSLYVRPKAPRTTGPNRERCFSITIVVVPWDLRVKYQHRVRVTMFWVPYNELREIKQYCGERYNWGLPGHWICWILRKEFTCSYTASWPNLQSTNACFNGQNGHKSHLVAAVWFQALESLAVSMEAVLDNMEDMAGNNLAASYKLLERTIKMPRSMSRTHRESEHSKASEKVLIKPSSGELNERKRIHRGKLIKVSLGFEFRCLGFGSRMQWEALFCRVSRSFWFWTVPIKKQCMCIILSPFCDQL